MRTACSLLLVFLTLALVNCGRSKKDDNKENELKPAVHKAGECPENIVGRYLGTVQKRRMVYHFKSNQQGSLFAHVTIQGVNDKTPVAVPVNGTLLVTEIGVTSMGCEDGQINTMSVLDKGIYKAKISFNDQGFQLTEIQPADRITPFNKVDE